MQCPTGVWKKKTVHVSAHIQTWWRYCRPLCYGILWGPQSNQTGLLNFAMSTPSDVIHVPYNPAHLSRYLSIGLLLLTHPSNQGAHLITLRHPVGQPLESFLPQLHELYIARDIKIESEIFYLWHDLESQQLQPAENTVYQPEVRSCHFPQSFDSRSPTGQSHGQQ